jgi:hypothetical protein
MSLHRCPSFLDIKDIRCSFTLYVTEMSPDGFIYQRGFKCQKKATEACFEYEGLWLCPTHYDQLTCQTLSKVIALPVKTVSVKA